MVDGIESSDEPDKGIVESSSELFALREANLSMIFLVVFSIIIGVFNDVSYTHLTLPTIYSV